MVKILYYAYKSVILTCMKGEYNSEVVGQPLDISTAIKKIRHYFD